MIIPLNKPTGNATLPAGGLHECVNEIEPGLASSVVAVVEHSVTIAVITIRELIAKDFQRNQVRRG